MPQSTGYRRSTARNAETVEEFCRGLLGDVIDHVRFDEKAMCSDAGDEWPDFANICCADFGVTNVRVDTCSKITAAVSGPTKRNADSSSDAKGDGSTKRAKGDHIADIASKPSKKKKFASSQSSKDSRTTSTSTVTQKTDYIHVRARRGEATDRHSLAERVRRERISERMRYLQELVPGCSQVTGKAGMLDEIINYVLSLQKQVEFLSMKLATVNPVLNCNVDDLFSRQINQACRTACLPAGITIPVGQVDQSCIQFKSMQPAGSCFGLDMVMNNSQNPVPGGAMSTTMPASDPPLDSCLSDIALQDLCGAGFHQGNGFGFELPFQSQGDCMLNNLKMEM